MGEKKSITISITGFFLVLALIAIIVMGYFMFRIATEKAQAEAKVETLNSEVNDLEGAMSNLQGKIDNIVNTLNTNETTNSSTQNTTTSSNQSPALSEQQQKELFNKITAKKALLQEMVLDKDFKATHFTDDEILKLLPILDDSNYFTVSNTNEGDFAKATIQDIQSLSQKYFGKNIDVNKTSGKVDQDTLSVEIASGYGIVKYELVSVSSKSNGEYSVKFNYIEEKTATYILTVKYEKGNIVYVSLEK